MHQQTTRSSLSPLRGNFIGIMQRLWHGRIENLLIERGEPIVFGASIFRHIKIGGESGTRPELQLKDYVLRSEVVELFRHFDELGDGRVALIQVRKGLPCHVVIQQDDFTQQSKQAAGDSNL